MGTSPVYRSHNQKETSTQDTATGIKWAYVVGMMAIVILAMALRLHSLDKLSFWVDEGFTYELANTNPVEIVALSASIDNHPPLHYELLWGWMQIAGSSVFASRFLSVFTGVLAVVLLGHLAYRWFGRFVGLASALLLALSAFHIWQSQELRMYSLLACLGIAAMTMFIKVQEGGGRKYWVALVVLDAMAAYTHYYGIFIGLAQGLCWLVLVFIPGSVRRIRTGIAVMVAGLLFSPWLLALLSQFQRAPHDYVPPLGPLQIAWNIVSTFAAGEIVPSWAFPYVSVFLALAMLGVLPIAVSSRSRRVQLVSRAEGEKLLLVIFWLLAPFAISYLMAGVLHVNTRVSGKMYYIVALPAYFILVGRGLDLLGRVLGVLLSNLRISWRIGYSATTLALLVGFAMPMWNISAEQFATRTKEDFKGAAAYITRYELPGDQIILHSECIYRAFAAYYHGISKWDRAVMGDENAVDTALSAMTTGDSRVWLLLSHENIDDPRGLVLNWFYAHGFVVDETWLHGIHLLAFSMGQQPDFQKSSLVRANFAQFGNIVRMNGTFVYDAIEAGSGASVMLNWKVLQAPEEDIHVVLMLEDASGRVWAQSDKVPVAKEGYPTAWVQGESLTDYHNLNVPLGTPPGEYSLQSIMYTPSNGQRIPVSNGGDHFEIAKVHVVRTSETVIRDRASEISDWDSNDVGDSIRLLQPSPLNLDVKSGESQDVELLWQAIRAPQSDLQVRLALVGADGRMQALPIASPLGGRYPSSQWTDREYIRDFIPVKVPNDLAGGEYSLMLGVESPGSQLEPKTIIGKVFVEVPERIRVRPSLDHEQRTPLADQIEFEGYNLASQTIKSGGETSLTLCWQALSSQDISYTVFTHLLDANNQVVAQQDALPMAGVRPTSTWAKGEYILDQHVIPIPDGVPAGQYRVEIGMYQASNGQRLGQPGADSLILTESINIE